MEDKVKIRNKQLLQNAKALCKWFNQTKIIEDLISYWFEIEYPKLKLDKVSLIKAREITKGRIFKDYPEIMDEHIEQYLTHGKIIKNLYGIPEYLRY